MRREKFGVDETYPSTAQLLLTQMRFNLVGEPAEARGILGGIRAQRANVANIRLMAVERNQETSARAYETQNTVWRQLGRGRRDISEVARQLSEPYQPRILRAAADRREEFEARAGEFTEGNPRGRDFQKRKRKGASSLGQVKGKSPEDGRSPERRAFSPC